MGAALPYIAVAAPFIQQMMKPSQNVPGQAPQPMQTPGDQTAKQPAPAMSAPQFKPSPIGMGQPMKTPPDMAQIIKLLTGGQ